MSKVFDAFCFNDELDLLEARLVELDCSVYRHVLVEAEVDHQDHPKPLHYMENRERFAPWADRIIHVVARDLPTVADDRDAWAREHAQREWIGKGLENVAPDDVILQSDLDEIPTAVAARNVRPRGMVAFDQTLYCFAVDWQHPDRWRGTVAARAGTIRTFSAMRDARNVAPALPNAGWHLSWLGGNEQQRKKLGSFCHPEVGERIADGLSEDSFYREGWHVDGAKLRPVDVDATWPRWIRDGRCPKNWYRPR